MDTSLKDAPTEISENRPRCMAPFSSWSKSATHAENYHEIKHPISLPECTITLAKESPGTKNWLIYECALNTAFRFHEPNEDKLLPRLKKTLWTADVIHYGIDNAKGLRRLVKIGPP